MVMSKGSSLLEHSCEQVEMPKLLKAAMSQDGGVVELYFKEKHAPTTSAAETAGKGTPVKARVAEPKSTASK